MTPPDAGETWHDFGGGKGIGRRAAWVKCWLTSYVTSGRTRGPKKEKGSGLAQPFGILGPCSWGRRSLTRKGEKSHKIHSYDVRESSVCVRDELSSCAT